MWPSEWGRALNRLSSEWGPAPARSPNVRIGEPVLARAYFDIPAVMARSANMSLLGVVLEGYRVLGTGKVFEPC